MTILKVKYYFKKIIHYLFHPSEFFIRKKILQLQRNEKLYTDEEFIKAFFKLKIGNDLNLDNPVTFNEKIQWLKLFDRNPLYTTMVDKHAVKKYVCDIIGDEYIATEYACFDSFDDIDFSKLPDKFVLKTTHTSGCVYICKDKNKLDISQIRNKFVRSLNDDYFMHCREWPYKNVPHRIIAEELLETPGFSVLPVYKFFCFNGQPFILQAIKNDKQLNEEIDYYDLKWQKLKLRQNYQNCKKAFPKPQCFEKMVELARKLSKGIPFVRCDFFEVCNKVYFSEFTFFSDAGFEKFHPKKWDFILGNKIELPRGSK